MQRHLTLVFFLVIAAFAVANDQGDVIVAKLKAMQMPSQQGLGQDEVIKGLSKYYKDRNELIWKLFTVDPKNPATAGFMEERWSMIDAPTINLGPEHTAKLQADIDKALATKPPQAIVEVADFCLAQDKLSGWISNVNDATVVCESFAKKYPQGEHGPNLYMTASYSVAEDQRYPLFKSMASRYPNSQYAVLANGVVRQHDDLGKPFELNFTDALTGKPVSMSYFHGKVVLLDFWATWCGPCVEKIPHLKELEAKYGPNGFAIVGVSLDMPENQGGLTKLREFAKEKALSWPQFYEGKQPMDSFAVKWGISVIPTTFLIDRAGNLREVLRKDPEESIKKLLAEK